MQILSCYLNILSTLPCFALAKVLTVQSYAALGDSYAAGDGAGSSRFLPNLDITCGRFSGAYPVQIANSSHLNVQPFEFWNVACGGATTKSVILKQLTYVNGVDLVTIQVGGNEVDFFPVLNECIQQWRPLSTCDRALTRARRLIQSTYFVETFHNMVAHAAKKMNGRGLLLILGYAKFFDAETEQCNSATFSKTNPANVLSNELRRTFNGLVVMLNDIIRASAEASGAVYVDVDGLFEGHRFCEEGVEEPRPDWEGTWFFREKGQKSKDVLQQLLFEPDRRIQEPKQLSWPNPLKEFADLTRTFHPTPNGHVAIAEKVVDIVRELQDASA
ncbi:hypothetical protein H2198_006120 [Neophaeococcomyces mojaviensis]|uniref:Uncharacterized protein n=1 Tax=Neophaeococcomyces mojaviensis TaxID=3383035 RepID=A0ACC3A3W1_9EURO|nr:hypothetical protein H2198_006120 [Knufia sp. JES_112]